MNISEPLEDYILHHIDAEHDYLYQLWRDTNIHIVRPHMVSGHWQGVLLRMLVHMIKPRRILEIGTYTGYATLCMASALDDGGRIVTCEINDELEPFTRPRLDNSPWGSKIDFHIGDVLTDPAIASADDRFDLIFIDGNKRQYPDYYHFALDHLQKQGYIIADNTLWDQHVIDPLYNDPQTLGIRRFNDLVAGDPRLEKVILPLRDGLTLIRLKN